MKPQYKTCPRSKTCDQTIYHFDPFPKNPFRQNISNQVGKETTMFKKFDKLFWKQHNFRFSNHLNRKKTQYGYFVAVEKFFKI